ncbi:MAG TPA: hypothetical protein PLA90_13495 [Candidatus Sumerlaeota bacterium]|nr:hypothetical protein [Candidatus Sumerlaeota bacterium]
MLRFLTKLLLLVPFLLAIAVFNWKVDPANLFVPGYEEGIASLMIEGKNIIGPHDYDTRLLHILYANALKKPKDIVVLGTSRSFGITSPLFPGKTLYNASVQRGSLKDYVGIYGAFHRTGKLPKTIFLGAEPWLLNANNPFLKDPYPALDNDLHAMMTLLELDTKDGTTSLTQSRFWDKTSSIIQKYMALFSPTYLQKSMQTLGETKESGNPPQNQTAEKSPSDKRYRVASASEYPSLFADGSRVFRRNPRRSQEVIDIAAAQSRSGYFEGYTAFDPLLMNLFERLVTQMLKDKVQVVFVLLPFHPLVYDRIAHDERYSRVIEAESYFRKFAKQNGIPVYGSYNPRAIGIQNTDFLDDLHLVGESYALLFRSESETGNPPGQDSEEKQENTEKAINDYCKDIKTWYELRQAYLKNPQALALFDKKVRELQASFPEKPAGLTGIKVVGFEWIREKPQAGPQETLYRVNCLIRVDTPPVLQPETHLDWAVYGKVQEKDRGLFQSERFRKNGQFDLGIQNIPCQTWQAGDYYLISRTLPVPDVPYKLSFRFAILEAGGKSVAQPIVELGDSAQYAR